MVGCWVFKIVYYIVGRLYFTVDFERKAVKDILYSKVKLFLDSIFSFLIYLFT